VTLVLSWRKLLPDIEEGNLQCFPNEEISKSEVLDMVCAIRSSENINNGIIQQWLRSDACEVGFQQH
jgi:hypothetical protein